MLRTIAMAYKTVFMPSAGILMGPLKMLMYLAGFCVSFEQIPALLTTFVKKLGKVLTKCIVASKCLSRLAITKMSWVIVGSNESIFLILISVPGGKSMQNAVLSRTSNVATPNVLYLYSVPLEALQDNVLVIGE